MNKNNSLVFIHLSDIHFKVWKDNIYDLDKDLRNELEIDACKMLHKLGNVSAILVTGDIAFSGAKEEYQEAYNWLAKLCKKLKISEGKNIWTVPGNHDVDRNVIEKSHFIKSIHKRIREDDESADEELRQFLQDSEAGLLFKAIENYNRFARKYNRCDIKPETPFWEEDFDLNDGSVLRLMGLTSTLISNKEDDNKANKLVLGSCQYKNFLREDGVEYLTLCHHPPQWLIDSDDFEDSLSPRVRVQLFGHKHKQRIDKINDSSIRLGAGAVHPDRKDKRLWTPRYNWMAISVEGENDRRRLSVEIYPRIWKDEKFQADFQEDGSDSVKHLLQIDAWTPPELSERITEHIHIQDSELEPTSIIEQNGDGGGAMDAARQFFYRFFSLPYDVRLNITQQLNLIKAEDEGLYDTELFDRCFTRAKEKGVFGEIVQAVNKQFEENKMQDALG